MSVAAEMSNTSKDSSRRWLQFSGDEGDFPYWSEKFEAFMHTKKLRTKLLGTATSTEEEAYNIWAELVQCLDKRSVMMLKSECKGKGPQAWKVLNAHFSSTETPRLMNLLERFTSLSLKSGEQMVDYLIRAEELSQSIEQAGEKVSESLLISIVLKGLPNSFDYFKTVHDFSTTKASFSDVKKALKNFANSQELKRETSSEGDVQNQAFLSSFRGGYRGGNRGSFSRGRGFSRGCANPQGNKFQGNCHKCKKPGHKAMDCRVKVCNFCGICGHTEESCFKKNGRPTENSNFTVEFQFCCDEDNQSTRDSQFVVDSGCTAHMIRDRSLFSSLELVCDRQCLSANSSSAKVEGTGSVNVFFADSEGKSRSIALKNCLYIPSHSRNLISVSALETRGVKTVFSKPYHFLTSNNTMFPFNRSGNLYLIDSVRDESYSAVNQSNQHLRMGHNHDFPSSSHCDTCAVVKAHRQNRNCQAIPRKNCVLDLVYSDVTGPMQTKSAGGHRYAISFIDSHSRYGRVYFMKTKNESLSRFQQFCSEEGIPRALRTDGGGEYNSGIFRQFCLAKSIDHQFTSPYSPHQNGVAERRWRTCVEMAKCLMKTAGMTNEFWVRALDVAFYISNRCKTSSLPEGKTPFELFKRFKPDVKDMRVFGCAAFKLVEVHQPKLADKATSEVFVGYGNSNGSYVLFNPKTSRFSISRNVTFNELDFPCKRSDSEIVSELDVPENEDVNPVIVSENAVQPVVPVPQTVVQTVNPNPIDVPAVAELRRSARVVRPPAWLDNFVTGDECNFGCDVDEFHDVPVSIGQVMSSSNKDRWLEAIQVEYDALVKNGTWKLAPLPQGKKPLGGRWVLKIKRNENGEIEKFKARYVAKGYGQVYGSDYCETFAPTAKLTTVRMCLALAAHSGVTVFQIDVKSAYLNATLVEDIYLEQPELYQQEGQNGEKLYCHLIKSIYGLKQAGREWNRMLDKWFLDHDFRKCKSDPCLYISQKNGQSMYVLIWVDDILYFGSDQLVTSFKSKFSDSFKVDDRGVMKWFLGMQVIQDEGVIFVNQKSYIVEVLERFSMSECNPVSTPADNCSSLSKSSCPAPDSQEFMEMADTHPHYRSLVGNLLYMSVVSRPDISFIVSNLSQFLSNPGRDHWVAAKRVLRYLKGSSDLGLAFVKSENFQVSGFTDSDWGSNPDDRRSVSGFCFSLNVQSGPISWNSKKQATVALSSAEAEYLAMSTACQELVFLRSLMSDLGFPPVGPSDLLGDNKGAIALADNPTSHKRTKHIDIRHHFLRDLVATKQIRISHVPTEDNTADLFTKALPGPKFQGLRQKILDRPR